MEQDIKRSITAPPSGEDDAQRWRRRDLLLSLFVFVCGLAATLLVAWLMSVTAEERDRHEFESHVLTAEDLIVDRIETSIALLRGAAGLFSSVGNKVTVSSFRDYIDRLALREYYPGLLGIGFSRRLDPAQRDELEREMRAQGHENFRVWPDVGDDELHSIVFLEPLDERNQAAIGFNMYSNAIRRAAMARARDNATAAASGIVLLVQEIDEKKQPGFLIYLPVYRGGRMPETVEARRRQLIGFAYSPIRAVDFLSSAFTHEPIPGVSLFVYHGDTPADRSLLYRRVVPNAPSNPRFKKKTVIQSAGEPWTLEFQSASASAEAWIMPSMILFGGLMFSILLAYLVWSEAQSRTRVQLLLDSERAARAEAERANKMKDEFLATLSHELRTPLNAIVGWTHILGHSRLKPEELKAGVEAVDRNAKAQARLIDDLLDMSRIVAGKLRLELQTIDLSSVLKNAVASVIPVAEAKGVALRTHIEPAIGLIKADPSRIQQIVWNLLSNAFKFTPEGGSVDVTARRSGANAEITVKDTGVGLENQFLSNIFDRFMQADSTTTRQHGGLGLGLAIVKHLVEQHQGQVRAESAGKNLGSTFIVQIPLAAVEIGETATQPIVGRVAALTPTFAPDMPKNIDFAGVTVLVVDDECDARELVRLLLEDYQARVLTAASGQEAFEVFQREHPDLVLSDIAMPDMDGYALIRAIRDYERGCGSDAVGAIAFTAFARPEDRAEALHAGFNMHLVKPMNPVELITAVSRLVSGTAPKKAAVT